MPRKKITKKKLEYADGQSETKTEKSIESILGVTEKNYFGSRSEAEFIEKLQEMSLTAMQELAVRAGVFPSGTKPMLRNKLKKAFAEYMLNNGRITAPKTKQPHPEDSLSKKFMSIMNSWEK